MMKKSKFKSQKTDLINTMIAIIVFSSLFFSNLEQKQPSIESSNISSKEVSKEVSVSTGLFKNDVNTSLESWNRQPSLAASYVQPNSNFGFNQNQSGFSSAPSISANAAQQPISPVCTSENSVEIGSSYSGFISAIKGTATCIILTSDITPGILADLENMSISRDVLIKSKDSTKRTITYNYGFERAHTVITSLNSSNLFLENIKIKIGSVLGAANGVIFASGFSNVIGKNLDLNEDDSLLTTYSNVNVPIFRAQNMFFNSSNIYYRSNSSFYSQSNGSGTISIKDSSFKIGSDSVAFTGVDNAINIINSNIITTGSGPLLSGKSFVAQDSILSSTSFAGSLYYISADDINFSESTLNISSSNHRLIQGYSVNNANLYFYSSSYLFSTGRFINGTLYYDSNIVQTAQLNNLTIDSNSTRKSVVDLSSTSNTGPVVGFAEIYGELNLLGSIDFKHGFLNQLLHYSAWNLFNRETNLLISNPDFPYIKLMGTANNVNIGNNIKSAILSYSGSVSLFSVYRDTKISVVNKSTIDIDMSSERSRSLIDVNGNLTKVDLEIKEESKLTITANKSLQGNYVDYSIFNVLDQSTGVSNIINVKLVNGIMDINVIASPLTTLTNTVNNEDLDLILQKQHVPLEFTSFSANNNSKFSFKTTDNRHPLIRTNSFITDNSNVMIQAHIPYATSEFIAYSSSRYHIFDSSDVSVNNPFEFKFGLTPTATNYQGGRLSIESTLSNGLGQQLLINTKDLTKVPYIKASIEGNYAFTKNQHASNHTIDRLSIIDSNIPMGKLTFDWNGTTYTDSLYNLQRVVVNDTNHNFDIPAPGTHFGFMWRRSTFVMGDFVTSFDENLRLEDGVYYFDFKVPLESTLEIWDGNTNLMSGVTITGQKQSVAIQNYNGGVRQLKIVSISTVPGMIASNFVGSQNLQKRFSLNVGVSKLDLQIGNDLSFGSVPLDNDMRNIPRLQPYSITVIDSDPSSTGWKLRLCVSDQLKPSDSSKLIANAFKYYDPISGVSSSIPELSCETNGIVIAESNTSTSLSGHVITWQPDNGILASIGNPWSLLIHEQYSATFKFTLTKN